MNTIKAKIFLLIILFVCASLTMANNTRAIKGKVIDKETTIPVEGATVKVSESEVSTMTGINGGFILEGLSFDTYDIKISRVGYKSISKIIISVSNVLPYDLLIKLNPVEISLPEINISPVQIPSLNLSVKVLS